MDFSRSDGEESREIDDRSSAIRRIELQWPDKGKIPVRRPDGGWQLVAPPERRVQIPFIPVDRFAGATATRGDSLVIEGQRLDALSTLRRTVACGVKLAYLDLPRIIVDDKTRAFQGEPNRTWSTYLSVVREHVRAVLPLLARDGVLVTQCGDTEEPYVRLALTELLGPQNHVGTVVWQRSYAPRNPKNMKEFTATHDPIIVFAVEKEMLSRVALGRTPQGFGNPDDDPRGTWRVVRQKGAATRREKTDFGVNRPPYRWRLAEGQLPPGLWRVSPLTGVIWGEPKAAGTYRFTVEVTDSAGNTATAKLAIEVAEEGEEAPLPIVPWLFDKGSPPSGTTADQEWSGVTRGSGAPKITTKALPRAVVDQRKYSAVLEAVGGQPFTGTKLRPKAPRNYEFTWSRLLEEMLSDKVDFGAKGDAVPRLRVHGNPEMDIEWVNQQTWWPGSIVKKSDWSTGEDEGVGFTEGATKHLEQMRQRGLIEEAVKTTKPESLLGRFVRIFTRPGDVVLEVFGEAADLAAVALKLDRRFIFLAGIVE
ncbi:MAG TPA: putative Ig domain-containing protein, partial [Polyangiaceae bacterium]|nr:putative Ig domain-containing protein [Polyangiaceae bacterium]